MQKSSELKYVNLLFLIVLVLQASNLLFLWMPQYVRLTLNEALFVFLPAYLYLRLTRQPVLERVRWQWPGFKIALLALLVGAGLYPLSGVTAGFLQQLLGYINFTMPADVIPTTVPMALLAVLAFAGMAPVCEEFLFRGVIQPVYEQKNSRWGILFVGFLFIVFHLSLLQGLSIILLSLALGFVNYRTRSLPASILTHVGANFLAALVITQGVFHLNITPYLFSVPAILGGLLITLVALVGLSRLSRPDGSAETAHPEPVPAAHFSLTAAWPLVLAGMIYLAMAGLEAYGSRMPAQVEPLAVDAIQWNSPQTWKYELRNVVDTLVGEGECTLTSAGAYIDLICSSFTSAYEVTIGKSTWMSVGGSRVDQIRWNSQDGQLVSGQTTLDLLEGEFNLETSWTMGDHGMDIRQVRTDGQDESGLVPYDETPLGGNPDLILVPDYTWPWQLAGINLKDDQMGEVVRFNPFTWRDATQDNGPVWEKRLVKATGSEGVTTPAGSFSARMVQFGDNQSAWYSLEGGLTVIKFFNGSETWLLK